eukprot:g8135.t1
MSLLVESLRVGKSVMRTLGARPIRQLLQKLTSVSDTILRKTVFEHSAKFFLSPAQTKHIEQAALSAKSILQNLHDSASEQTLKAGLTQVADYANSSMQIIERDKYRVLGPDDKNWATIKVLDDIWKSNLRVE